MHRDAKKYLHDIERACSLLASFTAGKKLDDYRADAMVRSAVERQFEIVGGALAQLLRVDSTLESRITDCHRIIAFRNRLIHG